MQIIKQLKAAAVRQAPRRKLAAGKSAVTLGKLADIWPKVKAALPAYTLFV